MAPLSSAPLSSMVCATLRSLALWAAAGTVIRVKRSSDRSKVSPRLLNIYAAATAFFGVAAIAAIAPILHQTSTGKILVSSGLLSAWLLGLWGTLSLVLAAWCRMEAKRSVRPSSSSADVEDVYTVGLHLLRRSSNMPESQPNEFTSDVASED